MQTIPTATMSGPSLVRWEQKRLTRTMGVRALCELPDAAAFVHSGSESVCVGERERGRERDEKTRRKREREE